MAEQKRGRTIMSFREAPDYIKKQKIKKRNRCLMTIGKIAFGTALTIAACVYIYQFAITLF